MDHIFIKEEVEETCDVESVSSASDSFRFYNSPSYSSPYCNTISKTSNASITPTQRVFPSKINQEQTLSSKPPELKRKGPELDHLSKPKHKSQSISDVTTTIPNWTLIPYSQDKQHLTRIPAEWWWMQQWSRWWRKPGG